MTRRQLGARNSVWLLPVGEFRRGSGDALALAALHVWSRWPLGRQCIVPLLGGPCRL